MFASAISVAALPQGLPVDWSHRHLIYSNPETQEEAAARGAIREWNKRADDPRFVLQFEPKEAKVSGNTTSHKYTLRMNGGDTLITCTIPANGDTCSNTANEATYAAGDTIDVQVVRTGTQNLTSTFRVQLGWTTGAAAYAGLAAPGGTGGIVIDNTASGGGSQIYDSTLTSPGNAVQASQAGLQ